MTEYIEHLILTGQLPNVNDNTNDGTIQLELLSDSSPPSIHDEPVIMPEEGINSHQNSLGDQEPQQQPDDHDDQFQGIYFDDYLNPNSEWHNPDAYGSYPDLPDYL